MIETTNEKESSMCAELRIIPLGLVLTMLAGCGGAPPSSPATPTPTTSPITSVSISGVPASPTVGQSVQLRALITRQDGTASDGTSQVAWQSSDAAVATVNATGLLAIAGPGDADVTATLQSVRGSAHVTVSKPIPPPVRGTTISGVIHESAPTEDVVVAGATVGIHFVGCPTCPNDNQSTTTDDAGHFTLTGVEIAGFGLVVSKPGYETTTYGIAELPRDQHPDISLPPTTAQVRLDIQGHDICTDHPLDRFYPGRPFSPGRLIAELPVHHDGYLEDLCGKVSCAGAFDIGTFLIFYRVGPNGQPIVIPEGGGPVLGGRPVLGGHKYNVVVGGDIEFCRRDYNYAVTYTR